MLKASQQMLTCMPPLRERWSAAFPWGGQAALLPQQGPRQLHYLLWRHALPPPEGHRAGEGCRQQYRVIELGALPAKHGIMGAGKQCLRVYKHTCTQQAAQAGCGSVCQMRPATCVCVAEVCKFNACCPFRTRTVLAWRCTARKVIWCNVAPGNKSGVHHPLLRQQTSVGISGSLWH